jgi:hypothetical protein
MVADPNALSFAGKRTPPMSAKSFAQSRAFRHNVRVLRFRHVLAALAGLGVVAAGIASAVVSLAHM